MCTGCSCHTLLLVYVWLWKLPTQDIVLRVGSRVRRTGYFERCRVACNLLQSMSAMQKL